MRRVLARVEAGLLGQRGHLFPWVPVFLAIGIGGYFALRFEPPVWALISSGLGGLVLICLHRWCGALSGTLLLAAGLVACGAALAGARAQMVAAPLIEYRYYGPIEGRIVDIDRSASDAVRLTLDQVVLERMAPDRRPERVRVALHGEQGYIDPAPGMRVILTGHLSAANGPVEPGGFDFRRHAWFQRLGAVGYTRTPVLNLEEPGPGLRIFAARMALSERVQNGLPGETGAFAAAIMTGDRSGMGQGTLTALRHSNLAHLLAISGLHMGLLAGFVFGVLRLGLIGFALRHPVKKFAATGALAVAAGYLALSGGNVATERAFVMVAVALLAVLSDRRAISLRAVAIAALIVLLLRPEALLGPGFQMSFAATTALVAVFAALRHIPPDRRGPKVLRAAGAVVLSSLVAGLATAPVAMAHFNIVSHYGLLANLVSVPLMGVLVMPAAVLAALLMPLGLDWIGLALMKPGLDWILSVAHRVSGWDGAVGTVVAPDPVVLPLLALGMLFVLLWQGRLRWAGVAPATLAGLLWVQTDRPPVLIASDGRLVGVMGVEGRALSRVRGNGFAAEVWLENDGDGADQPGAAARWPGGLDAAVVGHALGTGALWHVPGKRAAEQFSGCAKGDVVVSPVPLPRLDCLTFGPEDLEKSGAVALWPSDTTLPHMLTARQVSGQRIWHGAAADTTVRLAHRGPG